MVRSGDGVRAQQIGRPDGDVGPQFVGEMPQLIFHPRAVPQLPLQRFIGDLQFIGALSDAMLQFLVETVERLLRGGMFLAQAGLVGDKFRPAVDRTSGGAIGLGR